MTPEELLEALAAEAADDRPLLTKEEQAAMVGGVLSRAAKKPVSRRAWPLALVAAVVLLASVGFGAWSLRSPTGPVTTVLATGDRIHAADEAIYRVASDGAQMRRIEMGAGAVLFDVVPLKDAEAFVVSTPVAEIRVLGTVFSVEVSQRGTTLVRVYEGRVLAGGEGAEVTLEAGEQWSSAGGGVRSSTPGEFDELGRRAARERMQQHAQAPSELEVEANPPLGIDLTGIDPAGTDPTGGDPIGGDPRADLSGTAPILEAAVEAGEAPREGVGEPSRRRRTEVERPELSAARAALRRGDAAEAQRLLDMARRTGSFNGEWAYLAGDIARSAGRHALAARAYEDAIPRLMDVRRAQAAFQAATAWSRGADLERALRVLEDHQVTQEGAPLEERGLMLRIRVLVRSARQAEAQRSFERYEARFPESTSLPRLRGLVE